MTGLFFRSFFGICGYWKFRKAEFWPKFSEFWQIFSELLHIFLSFNLFSFKFWLTFCDFTHFYLNFALIFEIFQEIADFQPVKRQIEWENSEKLSFMEKNPEFWANLLSFGKILSFGVAEF